MTIPIVVTPSQVQLQVGESVEFSGSSDQFPIVDPHWETDTRFGTISVDPDDPTRCTFTATAPGMGYVILWEGQPRGGSKGSADITVTAGSSQQLDSIVVSPSSVNLEVGEQQLFSAVGYDVNGDSLAPPITPVWSTDGGSITQAGAYTAPESEGTFTVTASVVGSSVTGSAEVTVTAGSSQQLDSIVVSPSSVNLEVGEQQLFSAVGYDVNGDSLAPPVTPVWSTDGGSITQAGAYTAPEMEGTFTVTARVAGSSVVGRATVAVSTATGVPLWVWILVALGSAALVGVPFLIRRSGQGNSLTTALWITSLLPQLHQVTEHEGRLPSTAPPRRWALSGRPLVEGQAEGVQGGDPDGTPHPTLRTISATAVSTSGTQVTRAASVESRSPMVATKSAQTGPTATTGRGATSLSSADECIVPGHHQLGHGAEAALEGDGTGTGGDDVSDAGGEVGRRAVPRPRRRWRRCGGEQARVR